MDKDRWDAGRGVLLVILLLLVPVVGVFYLIWLIFGRKGLFWGLGLGCGGVLLFLGLFLVTFLVAGGKSEFGEHVEQVSWLPEEATDISFYRSYHLTAYEFQISEKGFRKLNSRWEFSEITEPENIMRYNYVIEYEKYRSTEKNGQSDRRAYYAMETQTHAHVKNGIVASYRQANGGGYHAVYDRESGRGYIRSSPR